MPVPFTDEKKVILAAQIGSLYAEYGFDGISMDEVARRLQVSKATLYKYFKSKEDIVRNIVNEAIARRDSICFSTENGIEGILKSTAEIYANAVLADSRTCSEFLESLKKHFPDLYEANALSVEGLLQRFQLFYEQAAARGFCKQLPFWLLGEQVSKMLPIVIEKRFLEKYHITQEEALRQYYKMFLYQILSEPYLYVAEQEQVYAFIKILADAVEGRIGPPWKLPAK